MTQTEARIKKEGKHFEILVDMDKALEFKKSGKGNSSDFLEHDEIYEDIKKGERASEEDLKQAFGTQDINVIAEKIVKSGEVLISQEHRDAEQEKRFNQVVEFLTRNSIDPQTKNPHTAERIKSALKDAHVNITNKPIESQMKEILESLSKIIPIKIETKKLKITIPAMHTGKAYGVITEYKENENWLSNGDLEMIVNVPAGILMDFYDKLNSVTHGSALSEEINEE
ncbi:MAG: ribosome assembly factor SBDS [Nanoarchaeota archaeon]